MKLLVIKTDYPTDSPIYTKAIIENNGHLTELPIQQMANNESVYFLDDNIVENKIGIGAKIIIALKTDYDSENGFYKKLGYVEYFLSEVKEVVTVQVEMKDCTNGNIDIEENVYFYPGQKVMPKITDEFPYKYNNIVLFEQRQKTVYKELSGALVPVEFFEFPDLNEYTLNVVVSTKDGDSISKKVTFKPYQDIITKEYEQFSLHIDNALATCLINNKLTSNGLQCKLITNTKIDKIEYKINDDNTQTINNPDTTFYINSDSLTLGETANISMTFYYTKDNESFSISRTFQVVPAIVYDCDMNIDYNDSEKIVTLSLDLEDSIKDKIQSINWQILYDSTVTQNIISLDDEEIYVKTRTLLDKYDSEPEFEKQFTVKQDGVFYFKAILHDSTGGWKFVENSIKISDISSEELFSLNTTINFNVVSNSEVPYDLFFIDVENEIADFLEEKTTVKIADGITRGSFVIEKDGIYAVIIGKKLLVYKTAIAQKSFILYKPKQVNISEISYTLFNDDGIVTKDGKATYIGNRFYLIKLDDEDYGILKINNSYIKVHK